MVQSSHADILSVRVLFWRNRIRLGEIGMDWLKTWNRKRITLFSVLFLSLICFVGRANASPDEPNGENPAPIDLHGLNPSEFLRAKFFFSLQLVFQERYADAGDEIHSLLNAGRDFGYRNFPEFSQIFLHEAEKVRSKNPELSAFFVRQAMALSPSELSVAISAFAFSDVLERKVLWKHFQETFWPSLKRPSYFVPVLINVTVLLLSALTIAALIGGFIQLLRNGELVFRYITRFIPRNYRGVLGPAAVLGVIAIPLMWGPGIAIACWAAILGRSLRHCRWYSFLVGIVLVGWMGVINWAIPMKAVLSSRINRVVDQVNSNGLVLDAEPLLRDAAARDPRDPLLALTLGKVLLFEGNFSEGEKMLRLADGLASGDGELSRVARLNLAVIGMRQKNWDEARQILESDEATGGNRFEVLYNLALVHLAQLDIEKYRSYYTQAQDFDHKEWQRVDSEQGQQHLPIWSSIHSRPFASAYFQLPVFTSEKDFPGVLAGQQKLASAIVRGGDSRILGIIGLLLVALVFVRRSRSGKQWSEQHQTIQLSESMPKDSSLLWSLLPGGVFLAGKRPVFGILFATVCFGVAFVMTGWPLNFLPISEFPLSLQKHALSAFIVVYGIGFIFPVLFETLRRPNFHGGAR